MSPLDPATAPGLRWGIIGAGNIAAKFVDAVTRHTQSEVVAVGSRSKAKAVQFAATNGVAIGYEGYDTLVQDPAVQAIYVATPNSEHLDHALLAIEAGKPVLIEKPLCRTAGEARQIAAAARGGRVFAMEAMWSRFLPHMVELREVVASGQIGEVLHVHAEHSQRIPFDRRHRIYDKELGGGALLDLGVYAVALVQDLLGKPDRVAAVGSLTETGVDGHVTLALDFGRRRQASVSCTLWGLSGIPASVLGTDGRVEFAGPFHRPTAITVHHGDGNVRTFDGHVPNGFQFEVAEVATCVSNGVVESELLSLDDSISVLEILDEARRQVGVRYPQEHVDD
jgi:predicted dehydrogenase